MKIGNFGGLRVLINLNDPARKPSEVRVSKLTPEEVEAKYGKPNLENKKHIRAYFNSTESKLIRRRKTKC